MFCPLCNSDMDNTCNIEMCAPARMIGGEGAPVCPIAEIASGVGLLCMAFVVNPEKKTGELTPLQKTLQKLGVEDDSSTG